VIALALVAGAIGALLAASSLRRLEVGHTWRDWQSARSPGWFTVLQVVLVVMFLGGMILARPVELKVVLLGVPAGFCLVYFSIGIRRRFGRTTRPEPVEDDLEELEPPEPWWWKVVGFTGALLIAVLVGYLVGLRGVELVGVSVFLLVVVIVSEKLSDRIAAWIRG